MKTTLAFRNFPPILAFLLALSVWAAAMPSAVAQLDKSTRFNSTAERQSEPLDNRGIQPDLQEERGYAPPEEDPWEGFNETMFNFNWKLDRYVVKPIAKGYDFVLPRPAQTGIKNAIDNIDVVRRVTNNLLQAKFTGAGSELARFTINSTLGVAGFVDVAKLGFGIEPSDEDTGQTFGVWGMGPGPYLVLPFLPVMTVRDGIGGIFDRAMHPLTYVSLFVDGAEFVSLGVSTLNSVNDRSLNLDTFEQIEETAIDLYGAVRDGYLQSREAAVRK